MANTTLQAAKAAKNDEFYTQLSDIEKELRHYKEHFKGKTVLCNCDDPRVSEFFRFFAMNFEFYGLKRLITTCYKNQDVDIFSQRKSDKAVYLIYDGDKNGNGTPDAEEIGIHPLKGDGDFRSKECIELLKQADIVVTNPPFSLLRDYFAQLFKYNKKFLIIGTQNAIHYKEIFPLLKDNKMWLGYNNGAKTYGVPDTYTKKTFIVDNKKYTKLGNTIWYTNLDHQRRHESLTLYKKYSSEEYPHYENYDAIDVNEIASIPEDYYGIMGVPDTFLGQYNPNDFEIIGLGSGKLGQSIGVGGIPKEHKQMMKGHSAAGDLYMMINGKPKVPYSRILIRRRK